MLEKYYWKAGFIAVAGLDEVGRGCFAGPVVTAACVFTPDLKLSHKSMGVRIDDSKRLSPKNREAASKWIKDNVLVWALGEASVVEINRRGMKKASEAAFRRAVYSANTKLKSKNLAELDYLLIDAFYIPKVAGLPKHHQKAILGGDSISMSIAAASIVAKVYRDRLMSEYSVDSKYKNYGWERNKGYGTKAHQQALLKYGTTDLHRKAYINTWKNKNR